jgi:hypothetical protein
LLGNALRASVQWVSSSMSYLQAVTVLPWRMPSQWTCLGLASFFFLYSRKIFGRNRTCLFDLFFSSNEGGAGEGIQPQLVDKIGRLCANEQQVLPICGHSWCQGSWLGEWSAG